MAPKRKATQAGGPSSKRVASGMNTPVTVGSDDDYRSDGEDGMSEEEEAPGKYDGEWFWHQYPFPTKH